MHPEKKEVLSVYTGSLFQNLKLLCKANVIKAVWNIAGFGKTVFQCVPAVGHHFHSCGIAGFMAVTSLLSHLFFLFYVISPLGFSEIFTKC